MTCIPFLKAFQCSIGTAHPASSSSIIDFSQVESFVFLKHSPTRYNVYVSAKERLPSLEIDPQVARAFAETFIPRWDCYPLQLQDGSYVQKREPLILPY